MATTKRNPGAGDAGARKAVLVGTTNSSENSQSVDERQALFISRRCAVPLALASLIASLAFARPVT